MREVGNSEVMVSVTVGRGSRIGRCHGGEGMGRRIGVTVKIKLVGLALAGIFACGAATTAPAADALRRGNPRSAVTAFLETCHSDDYETAAEYLDLSRIEARARGEEGPKLAKELEAILNSATSFDVLRLSQDAQGNLGDDPDPNIEHVTTVGGSVIELQKEEPANGTPIWVFSASTVAKIPELAPPPGAEAQIEARLPRFLVKTEVWETPLWKWIALLLAACGIFVLSRLALVVFNRTVRAMRFAQTGSFAWIQAVVDPLLVLLSVAVFKFVEAIIGPAALSRLYIGRALLLVVVAAMAWGLINLLDYLLVHLDLALNQKQRVVSSSVMYLSRRVLKTIVVIFAIILIFDNWGFNMTTIIAGLGVGGIAVALAAQQTIANVFGGVSVIGDAPVMLGDFGNFGGVTGTVEQIGLRSARIRTLHRTLVSIPNSSFAGINLENYAARDKILFNPSFQIKRATAKDAVRRLIQDMEAMLQVNQQVEVGPTPVRISGYSAAAFTIEIFVYVRTRDIDEYYKHQADLYLAMDEVVTGAGVELV